jgi:hypothetical protein
MGGKNDNWYSKMFNGAKGFGFITLIVAARIYSRTSPQSTSLETLPDSKRSPGRSKVTFEITHGPKGKQASIIQSA